MLSVRRLILVAVPSLCAVVGMLVLPPVASAEGCPNAEYRVGPSANLPDCRAYEQVTPVEKDAGRFLAGLMGVGPDGAPDLVIESTAALAGLQDDYGIPGAIYSVERTGSGWFTSAMPPPASEYQTGTNVGSPLVGTSLDARSGMWFERGLSWPENRVDLLITKPGGGIEDVGTVTPPNAPSGGVGSLLEGLHLGINVSGWSDDLSHIFYTQRKYLWPFDTTEEDRSGAISLYEFVGNGNSQPMLVGLGNEGKLVSDCGTTLGSDFGEGENAHNAVSAEGNTVFFAAIDGQGCAGVNELYARVDNGQPDAHTVAISEPSKEEGSTPGDCEACDTEPAVRAAATFEGASTDGSKVFFATKQPLLGDDTTQSMYEYDFDAPAGERIVRVTGGDSTVSNPTAEVQGHAVAISEGGSHVYFVAHGVLTTNPNSQGQVAHQGANNLYVFERDAQYPSGRTTFIASLSDNDVSLWGEESRAVGAVKPDNVDVTPDGRFLVFSSVTEHLTPDDTSTVAQVFEYDAQTGSLVRVSIGQDGYNDNGNTDVAEASIPIRTFHGSDPTSYWSGLAVSADGSYVFFQSTDGLTPQALNHKIIGEAIEYLGQTSGPPVYANNVYEYHDGNVYLISDGRDVSQGPSEQSDVELVGTDASGADVLFTTVDQLAPTDIDSNIDVYDARIDGGFPAPVSPSPCTEDACQGALSPAPALLSTGSEFQAGGNPPLAPPVPVAKPKAKKAAKKKIKKKKAAGKRAKKARRATVRRGHLLGTGGRS
jgi:hypothetical protein